MKKICFLFSLSVVLLLGCKKSFDANRYAKPSDDALPGFLLYTGLSETATNNATNFLWLTRWMGYWARNVDHPPDEQAETYALKNDQSNDEWRRIYHNLAEYDELEKKARNLGFPFYVGAAKLMKAYCFSTLVDLYNKIPYKEAFASTTGGPPVYDDARSIYSDLITQLDSAFIYFEDARIYYQDHVLDAQVTDDQYDVMFGSAKSNVSGYSERLTLWEKLVNTVELKLLIHQSEINPGIHDKLIAMMASKQRKAAGFIGAGESATINPGYQQSNGKMNPFVALFVTMDPNVATDTNDYYRANTYTYKFFDYGHDPRKTRLYDSVSKLITTPCDFCFFDSDYFPSGKDTIFTYHVIQGPVVVIYRADTIPPDRIGSNYDGDPAALPYLLTDGVGGFHYGPLKDYNQDQFVFSDFESLFLQAEASQRGYLGTSGDAQNFYESAIRQNFIYLYENPYDPSSEQQALPDSYTYFAQNIPDVGWSAATDDDKKLEAILTQKWVAMNAVNWVEAYTDYRRTGFPTSSFLGISHAPTHMQPMIPIRLLYPESELSNPNLPQLGPGAQFTEKIFWDQ